MRQDIRNCSNISVDMSGVEENIANGISVSDAVEIVQDSGTTLVLDCRPFIAFNDSHIINALNVYCPPILKRRSNGFVSLENIVTCERRRRQLQDGHYLRVLCYDTDTEDLTQSGKDSNLYAVLKSLRQQVDISQISYIIGGFEFFRNEFPALCIGQNENRAILSFTPPPKYRSCGKGGPVEILPGLYLGDSVHSGQHDTLRELGITCLLNVSTTCKNMFEQEFDYMNIPVNDNDTANISCWFGEAIQFIDNARDNEGKVLVHCQAGVSRSATVCIAYLMFKNNMVLEEAFDHVRARRGVISPNLNFMQQLKEYEKSLFGGKVYEISDSVSSISTSLASVDFDVSSSSTTVSDYSASSGAFDFTFASSAVPPVSPRELVSPS